MRRFIHGLAATSVVVAVGVAAGSPAFSAPTPSAPATDAPNTSETFFNDMGATGDTALRYLKDLSDISWKHENEGFRALGTPGYAEASEYVEGVMRDLGYKVSRQDFDIAQQTFGTVELSVAGETIEGVETLTNGEGTTDPVTDVPLVLPVDDSYGDGTGGELGCQATDFGPEVAGAVVLVSRGECTFGDKVTNASKAGAVGVVLYNNADGVLNGTVGDRVEGNAPVVAIPQATGNELREDIVAASSGDGVSASLTVETEFTSTKTWNILAETPGGDPNKVQMLGSHLDGVDAGPAVNDNASGVAGLLTVAESLANYSRPVDNKVRFGFWGAEEIGLVGSTNYVNSLSEDELSKIQSYQNYDMIGSNNYAIATLDSNGDYRDIPEGVTVPDGSVELEQLYADYFDSKGQPFIGSEFSGRSDYQAFMDAGIPVAGLDSGADEVKTEDEVTLFGGTAGQQLDTNYHQITDTLDNVSTESVGIIVPAMANTTYQLAFTAEHKAEDAAKANEKPTANETGQSTDKPAGEPSTQPSTQETDTPGGTTSAKDDSDNNAGGSTGSLPRTGADVAAVLAGAAVLVAAGGGMLVVARRRKTNR